MRRSIVRRGRPEHGVTIVEAAFVLPIMFLFVFGLIDMGMWIFNSNMATNAARDGARAAILTYEEADVDGSDDHDAIVAAVRARLPGQTVETADIVVTCESGGSTVTCEDAEPDEDHIRVEVEWAWDLVTPIAGVVGVQEGAATGDATMAIVGLPVVGGGSPDPDYDGDDDVEEPPPMDDDADPVEPPADCAVTSTPIVAPSPVPTKGNQLTKDLVVTFTSNGSPACSELLIELVGTKTSPSVTTLSFDCACGTGPNHSWTYSGSDNIWSKNRSGTVRILDGATVLATRTFPVS